MAKIGYARVSTRGQNDDSQVDDLTAAGCEKIFTDTASGKNAARPELDKALAYLRKGDVFVITRLSRAMRSLKHLLTLADELRDRDVGLVVLKQQIDTTTPQGRLVTPPTQWITRAIVTLRVRLSFASPGGRPVCADGDAVPDGDLLRADEDVLDEQAQHPLAVFGAGGGGAAAQPAQEAFQVVGELEVGVAVGGLGVEGVDLAAQVLLAGAQVRHPGA